MLTDEERDLLATRLMGWHKVNWMWFGEKSEGILPQEDYLPDVDDEQAWDLVEAIGKMSERVKYEFIHLLEVQYDGIEWPFWWFLFTADKSAAIARAALAVARELETEASNV